MPAGRPQTTCNRERRETGKLRCISAWVDEDLWKRIKIVAIERDMTVSKLISAALEAILAGANGRHKS